LGHGIAHVLALAGLHVHLYELFAGRSACLVKVRRRTLDKVVELAKYSCPSANAAF